MKMGTSWWRYEENIERAPAWASIHIDHAKVTIFSSLVEDPIVFPMFRGCI